MAQKKAWSKSLDKPAREFSLTSLPILSGQIPEGLRGTLYRNGPARLERLGKLVGHWFDGDGAVLAVHFNDEGATGVYRYVQTKGYQEETAAGQFLYGNYGMRAPGPIWNQWFKPVKNSANTSVLALPERLLALWEGDHPYALDLKTLDTLGLDNLGGLRKGLPFSAHPKKEPLTGAIYNFGISLRGLNASLNLYKSDRMGKIIQQSAFPLKGAPLLHDFVLAGPYLIFLIPPARINLLPVIMGFKSYSDVVEWLPQLGTQILVFERETLQLVSRGETDPWFQWHFGNGYLDSSGSVSLDLVRYEDFGQTNQHLKEVATGQTSTLAKGTLWQMGLNPKNGIVISLEEVMPRSVEFPVVSPSQVGQKWSSTYVTVHRQGTDIRYERYDGLARFDYSTGTLIEADLGDDRYPSEPIIAPHPDNPEQGWVLSVIYDGNSHTSQVYIFDSERLAEEPVCVLGLPDVIPLSFHGTWRGAE